MSTPSRFLALLALAVLLGGWPAGSHPPRFVRAQIAFEERSWAASTIPSLTFTVSDTFRGSIDKVSAYLYFSDVPEPFMTSPFQRVFVGLIRVPGSASVQVFAPPQRGPINAHSRESFVQGAIFTVDTDELLGTTNETYLDIDYAAPPDVFELNFSTDDDFRTSLQNGQDLSTPPEFGRLISISALQPNQGAAHFGPAIFDTDPEGPNAEGADPDLLVGLGNALILQENGTQTQPGFFDTPDDAKGGGTIVFDFTGFEFIEKVRPISIDLIDIARGGDDLALDDERGTEVNLTMTDVLGHKRTIHVPAGWTEDIQREGPPGFRTLDLTTLDPQPGFQGTTEITHDDPEYIPGEIVRMEIELTGSGTGDEQSTLDDDEGVDGSGAIDNLVFEREADPGSFTGLGRR